MFKSQTIPNDLINETTLTTKLIDYTLKSQIPTIPNDLINKTTFTTALNDYALKKNAISSLGNQILDDALTVVNNIYLYSYDVDGGIRNPSTYAGLDLGDDGFVFNIG